MKRPRGARMNRNRLHHGRAAGRHPRLRGWSIFERRTDGRRMATDMSRQRGEAFPIFSSKAGAEAVIREVFGKHAARFVALPNERW